VRWHSLYDKVISPSNLVDAYQKVRRNKGAGGIDGVTLKQFDERADEYLGFAQEKLQQKRYRARPVRRVYIPKPNGKERPLGIPVILDRIVQQALLNWLGPIYEATFSEVSYGFRSGRSALDAIEAVKSYLDRGYQYVVEVDIEKYFDNVDHALLMKKLGEEVTDSSILNLIKDFLQVGVMEEGRWSVTDEGTPQGGVISPLLANVYLNSFDHLIAGKGYKLIRYADDFVILCGTKEEAEQAMQAVVRYLEVELHLRINKEKSRIVDFGRESFEFLGYVFYGRFLRPKDRKIAELKDEIRRLTRRQQPVPLGKIIERLNMTLRGWSGYFCLGHIRALTRGLDEWIRHRLRAFVNKRWGVFREIKLAYPIKRFESMGLVSMHELCYELRIHRNGLCRKAVYGKTVRTV
jgi:group II intron reverse transcriptase/maturase